MLDILFCMWYFVITKLMKGAIKMMKTTVEETAGILKRLLPFRNCVPTEIEPINLQKEGAIPLLLDLWFR